MRIKKLNEDFDSKNYNVTYNVTNAQHAKAVNNVMNFKNFDDKGNYTLGETASALKDDIDNLVRLWLDTQLNDRIEVWNEYTETNGLFATVYKRDEAPNGETMLKNGLSVWDALYNASSGYLSYFDDYVFFYDDYVMSSTAETIFLNDLEFMTKYFQKLVDNKHFYMLFGIGEEVEENYDESDTYLKDVMDRSRKEVKDYFNEEIANAVIHIQSEINKRTNA